MDSMLRERGLGVASEIGGGRKETILERLQRRELALTQELDHIRETIKAFEANPGAAALIESLSKVSGVL